MWTWIAGCRSLSGAFLLNVKEERANPNISEPIRIQSKKTWWKQEHWPSAKKAWIHIWRSSKWLIWKVGKSLHILWCSILETGEFWDHFQLKMPVILYWMLKPWFESCLMSYDSSVCTRVHRWTFCRTRRMINNQKVIGENCPGNYEL